MQVSLRTKRADLLGVRKGVGAVSYSIVRQHRKAEPIIRVDRVKAPLTFLLDIRSSCGVVN